ncbi:unnamed protein product, partial [Discosporangium mesarthrocarpum]
MTARSSGVSGGELALVETGADNFSQESADLALAATMLDKGLRVKKVTSVGIAYPVTLRLVVSYWTLSLTWIDGDVLGFDLRDLAPVDPGKKANCPIKNWRRNEEGRRSGGNNARCDHCLLSLAWVSSGTMLEIELNSKADREALALCLETMAVELRQLHSRYSKQQKSIENRYA